MVRRTWARVAGTAAVAIGIGTAVALPSNLQASAANSVGVIGHVPSTPLYDPGVKNTVGTPAATSATSTTSPKHFTAQVVDGTSTFTYTMVGKNPSKAQANGLTTVKTLLVPLVIKFSYGDTWDPTSADSCDSGASPLARTQESPIFVSQPWTWGGKWIGTSQVTDAFQRAEFWKYAKPTGVDPTYGVALALTTLAPQVVNVPDADTAFSTGVPCGNGLLGAVDFGWLDNYLQSTLIPSLVSQGVAPNTLPIFLLHNVVAYDGTTSNCCYLGYHSAYAPSNGVTQTYAVADYDNSSKFAAPDIAPLSHEVAEWQNDPFIDNATNLWGHIGQVSGCQSNLEVGDPLSGKNFADTVGGFTYHPQELAFFSWFFHQSPSIGVKKTWYSDQGTFTTSAAACS
jgi:hypothetical protein